MVTQKDTDEFLWYVWTDFFHKEWSITFFWGWTGFWLGNFFSLVL